MLLEKKQFEDLLAERSRFCISIYIPTHQSGENKDSLIRLKNEISKVENQLSSLGLKQKNIADYLEPIHHLVRDSNFWRLLSDALFIFRSKDKFVYRTLPIQVDEFSLVSDRFHLLPLLKNSVDRRPFYILQLSLNRNRLYEADQYGYNEMSTGDLFPENLEDTVGADVQQKSLQYRSGQTLGGFGLYHGKGEGKDDRDIEIEKYLYVVAQGVSECLKDAKEPLVVAAVENICSQFKHLSAYRNIYPDCVAGNYDNGNMDEVHAKACELLQPYFDQPRNESKERFTEAKETTTSNLNELLIAATGGRVDTVFIEKGKHVWGEFDAEHGKLKIHKQKEPMDSCLLDLAARLTYLQGGAIYVGDAQQLPGNRGPASAILRY